jgi:hypothetical protein
MPAGQSSEQKDRVHPQDEMAEDEPDHLRQHGCHHAAEQEADARLFHGRDEDRPRMDPGEPDESGKPERGHEGDGAIGNSSEQRMMCTQSTDRKPGEQSADAGAQSDFYAADGEGQENANEAAEENRQPKHDEVDLGARIDDGADLGGRGWSGGFWRGAISAVQEISDPFEMSGKTEYREKHHHHEGCSKERRIEQIPVAVHDE